MIDHYQPFPDWVYPYTFVNRRFDYILMTIIHQLEKDHNENQRLHDRSNQEWRTPYPYQSSSLSVVDIRLKKIITDVMDEINRRFNMERRIVGFRETPIHFHWINPHEVIIKLTVYKKYTIDDIKYYEAIDPTINDHLKQNFEREMIIYLDHIDDRRNRRNRRDLGDQGTQGDLRYHLKYLRFPDIDYEHDDVWDDLPYWKEYDTRFYLALSKDPFYRMVSNPEAREMYIDYLKKKHEQGQYKCFPPHLQPFGLSKQLRDQTDCELANGIWEKRCQTDRDCPYFHQNQHYPNSFGQCQKETGYCQMPIGVTPLTYRRPLNPKDAYCYNCQQGFLGSHSVGQCCPTQKEPDYMFEGDLPIRRKYAQQLANDGLTWGAV